MGLVSFKDVWLKYKIGFKENGKVLTEDFWALKGINLSIEKGEFIGIIGENGSGKTTLLKLIAGMLKPDRGSIDINGSVSALMEVGAGFQKELTGKENIWLISSLFGLTTPQIEARYDDIINFASIGRFINAPVKVYSLGMYMRLAFAIAIHVDPDILLVDDTFTAVGDIYAQRKCINKMFELREEGKTIIFVSHDIELSKRLCSNGILMRDGEIIKQGPIDKISAYYVDSVGDKRGIAIFQKGSLGVIFNNGRLILRWKDSAITTKQSGHVVMFSRGREYLSTTANWEFYEKKLTGEIVAIGSWPDIPVKLYWNIILINEREFFLEISIVVSEDISIEAFRTSVIFRDEYKSWFTLKTQTDFPDTYSNLLEWQCSIIEDLLDKLIGLKGNGESKNPLPTITFNRIHDYTRMICQIGNTGAEIKARGILFETHLYHITDNIYTRGKYKCFSGNIKIFDALETQELELYLNNIRKIVKDSTVIRKDFLTIFCQDSRVEIYWKERLVTSGVGLNTKFRYKDKEYSAAMGAHWAIHKESNEEMAICLYWDEEIPFSQNWRLKLEEEDSILWEIEMDIKENAKIRNKQTELVLSEEYKKWMTTEERGDIGRLEKKGSVVLTKYINNHIGVESVNIMDDFILPAVSFQREDTPPKISYISRNKMDVWATRLRYLEIDSREHLYTSPGRHTYFKGKIRIIADRKIEADLINKIDKKAPAFRKSAELLNAIESGRSLLVFEYGKGRFFWNGIELTKGLGLYSSILFGGIWHDSSQAYWDVRKLSKEKLTAIGCWPWIPVVHILEIELVDEKTLFWKITQEIWEDTLLERGQVSIMLSDNYKEWFVCKKWHGKFPEKFSDHNGIFWDRLWSKDEALPIGIRKSKIKNGIFKRQFFPSVVFDFSKDCQIRYSVIENTDNLFQARVLQCELDPNLKKIDGREHNKYFEGQVKILT